MSTCLSKSLPCTHKVVLTVESFVFIAMKKHGRARPSRPVYGLVIRLVIQAHRHLVPRLKHMFPRLSK